MDLPDITTTVPWWHYAIALVAVIAALIIAGFVRRAVRKVLQRTKGVPETLADVTARFSGYLVILLGIGIGLAAIGIDVQPLLAIVLIVLVIAAFVLKGVADNFAAGVLLQTSHPVAPGDEVTVETPDGTATGTVVELGTRTVVVAAYDGRTVHVPNAQLANDAMVVTPAGASRRSQVQVRIERDGHDVDALLERLEGVAASVPGVALRQSAPAVEVPSNVEHGASGPAPQARPVTISPDRLIADLRFWHLGTETAGVTAAMVGALAHALAADGLTAAVTSLATPPPVAPPDPM